jgi:hypothetical protein
LKTKQQMEFKEIELRGSGENWTASRQICDGQQWTWRLWFPSYKRSVWRLAMGWADGDRIPFAARFSAPVQNSPEVQPPSYTKRPGRGFNTHPHLASRLKDE